MADSTPFKMYPRGFLGAKLEGRVETQTKYEESVLGFRGYKALVLRNQNDIDHSNPAIETLYEQYIKCLADTNSFEFRKKILIATLAAFGTSLFDFWYQMQFKSPVVGVRHTDFLEDTLRFIQTGRREMALETWHAIVTAEDAGGRNGHISEYANEFFGISSNGTNRHPQNRQLADIIQKWCSQPNGFEDMLGTLHLLFGNP